MKSLRRRWSDTSSFPISYMGSVVTKTYREAAHQAGTYLVYPHLPPVCEDHNLADK